MGLSVHVYRWYGMDAASCAASVQRCSQPCQHYRSLFSWRANGVFLMAAAQPGRLSPALPVYGDFHGVTAFPVLLRILQDRAILRLRLVALQVLAPRWEM